MRTRRSQKLIALLFITCLALQAANISISQTNTAQAQKIDEFGEVLLTDLKARLDNFAIALHNVPNSRAFIMIYRSRRDPPGINSRLAATARSYLIEARGFSPERVITVDGGVASCLMQELWVVPIGATPTPRSDAYSREIPDIEAAREFDEFYYAFGNDSYIEGYEVVGQQASFEAFATALRQEPRSLAYVLIYPQFYVERWEEAATNGRSRTRRRISLDPPHSASRMMREIRTQMINQYRIAPSRIRVINGGYRRLRQIELWIVPRGEHAPVATPNAFPPRRRRARQVR